MRRREPSDERRRRHVGRWEGMTGWADDVIDEEGEDGEDRIRSDGDILGDVHSPSRRRRNVGSIPYEQSWQTDLDAYQPGKVCSQSPPLFKY